MMTLIDAGTGPQGLGPTLRDVVLLAAGLMGKGELDLVGVFRSEDNLIASERRKGEVYALFTDGSTITIQPVK